MAEPQMTPEQIKALQEKIKSMSPEELKEFQKKQCIFCQIISGKIQAKKTYEDEKVIAILDINPSNPGHILLLTKEHYSIMPQLPDDELSHVFMVAKSLSNTMLRSIDAQGTNIIVANGIAAGQRAQHFMVHVIPRKEKDGVNFVLPQKSMEQSEVESVGNRIIAALGGSVEKEEKPPVQMAQFLQPKTAPETMKQDRKEPKQVSDEKSDSINTLDNKKNGSKKDNPKPKSGIDFDDIAKLLGAK